MITNLFQNSKPVISLEIFPPKRDSDVTQLYDILDKIKDLHPDFISVTYGAGGSTSKKTVSIASYIQNNCKIEALAHLTCVALNKVLLMELLQDIKSNKIQNILALRGDRPKDMTFEEFNTREFEYASDIIPIIKDFSPVCIAGACYPEKHIEASSKKLDLENLKIKIEKGADFLITQLFFDNNKFYEFLNNVRSNQINVPITAGIMPITSVNQIEKTINLSGATVPPKLSQLLERFGDKPDEMQKAGLDYATNQILDLIDSKVEGIHLYTMNKIETCKYIMENISL